MKRFFTLFLLAFVVGALALMAVYIEGRVSPPKQDEKLWHETIDELSDIARMKYRQSRRYIQYSTIAEQEGLHSEATLLRAIAKADAIQCENCIKAIESLGGIYYPPTIAESEMQETRQHLHLIHNEKNKCHNEQMLRIITRTLNEGNRYIARMLTWCDASDIEQIIILKNYLECPEAHDSLAAQYFVCPECGMLNDNGLSPYHCAHCMTPQLKFLIFK